MNTELLNQFFRFVKEREAIRIKRATGAPWPWSRDELLNNYHFTNVRRSDEDPRAMARAAERRARRRHGLP